MAKTVKTKRTEHQENNFFQGFGPGSSLRKVLVNLFDSLV